MVCSHSSGKSKNNAHSFDALDFLKQERDRLKLENSRLQEEIDTLEQSPYTRLGKAFTLCSQHPEIFGDVDLHKFCALFLDDNGHEECTHNDRDEDFCPNDEEDVDKICVCIHGSFEDDSGQ